MSARSHLDHSTFFKLVLVVNLTARPYARLHEQVHGLRLTEWRVLLAVAGRSGVSAAELTDALGLDKMAISRAVRALEKAGRIERRASARDARRSDLHLTDVGTALHAAILPSALAREAALLAGLGDADRAELGRILDQLVASARALPEEG